MKLKIRNMEVETDKLPKIIFSIYLIFQLSLVKKKRINYFNGLDDEDGNLDPRIAAHVREAGVNVERVLFEEVYNESFSQDTRDSFQPVVTSRPFFDSSVEHSSRPSIVDTSTTGYDGSRGEGPMMVVILEIMVGILQIHNKVNIH